MTDSHWILGNPEDALGTLGAQIIRHDQMLQLLSHTIMLGNSCQIANELETGLGNSPCSDQRSSVACGCYRYPTAAFRKLVLGVLIGSNVGRGPRIPLIQDASAHSGASAHSFRQHPPTHTGVSAHLVMGCREALILFFSFIRLRQYFGVLSYAWTGRLVRCDRRCERDGRGWRQRRLVRR